VPQSAECDCAVGIEGSQGVILFGYLLCKRYWAELEVAFAVYAQQLKYVSY
jgi:hypothetical protein